MIGREGAQIKRMNNYQEGNDSVKICNDFLRSPMEILLL